MKETLEQIYDRHAVRGGDFGHGDKGSTHSYIDEYERLLAPFRDKCSFIEIGLARGLSVAMWDEYFGEACSLFGVDIAMTFDTAQFPRWRLIEADATKPFLTGDETFDVVIDDGSHMGADQQASKEILWPRMNPGGLYIIEDILSLPGALQVFPDAEVIDLRQKKGRFDDILLIFRK